jgi:hypothetical protein
MDLDPVLTLPTVRGASLFSLVCDQGFGSAESCEHMIGTVVKTRVMAVDVEKRRLQLSLRLSTAGLTGAVGSDPEGTSVALGTFASGSIVSLEPGTPALARAVVRVTGPDDKTLCHGTLSLRECGDTLVEATAVFDTLKSSQKLRWLFVACLLFKDQL